MVRGGKREGAGRPAKESTTTVRVIERAAPAAKALAEHFLRLAEEAFCEKYRHTIEKHEAKAVVKLIGLEIVEARSMMGGRASIPVIVATGEMLGLRSTFEIGLDGTGFVGRNEEEI